MRRPTSLVGASVVLIALSAAVAPAASAGIGGRVVNHGTKHVMTTLESTVPTENRLPLIGGAPVGLPLE